MMTLRDKFLLKHYHFLIQLGNFSLGDNVVEDVRMHKVVFCKSMTFRWFADVEPEKEGVIIKIQRNRKEPIEIIQIKNNQKVLEFSQIIKDAFEKIH